MIDQLSGAERGERFRYRADVEERLRGHWGPRRQVSKPITLLEDDLAPFDQRQCRARDVVRRDEIEHQGVDGGAIERGLGECRSRNDPDCNAES